MPPLPKRKRSKSRQGTNNAHRHAPLPNLIECPNCHQLMHPHRVCAACGYYRGRDILGVESEL